MPVGVAGRVGDGQTRGSSFSSSGSLDADGERVEGGRIFFSHAKGMRNPWNGGGRCPSTSTPGVSWGRSGIAALSGGALGALKVLEATGEAGNISTAKVRLVGTCPWT